MAWVHVRHRVADYNKWKEVYDASEGFKRPFGWKRYRLFFVDGDRNDVPVMEEYERMDEARRLMQSKEERNAMDLGGVIGQPEVLYLQGLEEGLA